MAVMDSVITNKYAIYHGDCCEAIKDIPNNSIGFSVFSPPFADLYAYSDSDRDMGNCRSYEEFFDHFGHLITDLERVMMPGRIVAVHCMDLPSFKSKSGFIGAKDFPGDIIKAFEDKGFLYHCPRITIWKDPLIAATRTKALNLAHKQIVKDSAMCGVGSPDYVLAFRKKGDNPKPIAHPLGLTEYVGARSIPKDLDRQFLGPMDSHNLHGEGWQDPKTNKRSHWIWQQYASPVWFDIRQTNVLPFRQAREKDDQKHICPLQLDVIERCLVLWSAPDDTVLTPFMGVGSEVYTAVKLGRKGIGIELKKSYFRQAKMNLEALGKSLKSKGRLL